MKDLPSFWQSPAIFVQPEAFNQTVEAFLEEQREDYFTPKTHSS